MMALQVGGSGNGITFIMWACITRHATLGLDNLIMQGMRFSGVITCARSCRSWKLLSITSHSAALMLMPQLGWGQGMGYCRSSSLLCACVCRQEAQKRCRHSSMTWMPDWGTSSRQIAHTSVRSSSCVVKSKTSAALPACTAVTCCLQACMHVCSCLQTEQHDFCCCTFGMALCF